VLFAMELMLPEVSVDTFLPVAVATGTATFIGRLFFGSQPAFGVPFDLAAIPNEPSSAFTLALYAVLGAVIGVAAAGFVKTLHWIEDGFDLIPGRYGRHALGMLIVGIMMYGFWLAKGHYYIEGVGYSTIQATLHGEILSAGFLLLLALAKLLATSISLGATIGAAFAALVTLIDPGAPVSLPAFAMVGMGAMVGGGTGAAMTAVTMIFEMTRDYNIVLPMILAVALALGVRRIFSRENIYTMKLVRRGHPIPKALHANMFMVQNAGAIMERDMLVLDEATLFTAFLDMAADRGGLRHVVVTKAGKIIGGLRVNVSLRRAAGAGADDATLGALVGKDFIIVRENDVAFGVIQNITHARASMAIVIGNTADDGSTEVAGVITREHIADTVARSVQIYPG
jgi:CIC family chloride channel protein